MRTSNKINSKLKAAVIFMSVVLSIPMIAAGAYAAADPMCHHNNNYPAGTYIYDCDGESVSGSKIFASDSSYTFMNVDVWSANINSQKIHGKNSCTGGPYDGQDGPTLEIHANEVTLGGSDINFKGGNGVDEASGPSSCKAGDGGEGGNITIVASGDVSIGNIITSGGNGGAECVGGCTNPTANGDGGNSGNLSITTSSNSNINVNDITATGGWNGGIGGSVFLKANRMTAGIVKVSATNRHYSSGCCNWIKGPVAGRFVAQGGHLVASSIEAVPGNLLDGNQLPFNGLVDLRQVLDSRVGSIKIGGDADGYDPTFAGCGCGGSEPWDASTYKAGTNLCIGPTACKGSPSYGGILRLERSYGQIPPVTFKEDCGPGTTEVNGVCIAANCGPGTEKVDDQCVPLKKQRTIDFHGRAIDKVTKEPIESGDVEFRVWDNTLGEDAWGPHEFSNIIKDGVFSKVLGDDTVADPNNPVMNLYLGQKNRYSLIVIVKPADGLPSEQFELTFTA